MSETEHDDTEGTNRDERSEHSPVGFSAPEPELEDADVVCAGCGETDPASEMGTSGDAIVEADGAVVDVTRVYLHNDPNCMMAYVENGGTHTLRVSDGETQ